MSEVKLVIRPVLGPGIRIIPNGGASLKVVQSEVKLTINPTGKQGLKGDKGEPGAAGDGDMNKAVYDPDNDGVVEIAKTVQIINGGYF